MRHDEAPATRPETIPADAFGFISTRNRNGRIAAFRADGTLAMTWGFDMDDAVQALATGGYTVRDGIIYAPR